MQEVQTCATIDGLQGICTASVLQLRTSDSITATRTAVREVSTKGNFVTNLGNFNFNITRKKDILSKKIIISNMCLHE
jgi:hypothetical protein